MKILNYGSLNIDHVYHVPHFVRPGETLSSLDMQLFAGGKGLNQSIALARAGADVWHAGAIGKDGGMLSGILKDSNVNTGCLKIRDVPTGHAIIQIDENGQNCILLYGGANQTMNRLEIEEVLSHFEEGDILLLQNEINELGTIMELAFRRGLKIYLNPSPMNEIIHELPLSYVDCFLLNEVEAADICGVGEDEALAVLHDRFPKAELVLTLGSKGAVCMTGERVFHQDSFPVEAVDTTAAGDTFTGFYISAVASGKDTALALREAAAAAAIAVSRAGAAPSIQVYDEMAAFLKQMQG